MVADPIAVGEDHSRADGHNQHAGFEADVLLNHGVTRRRQARRARAPPAGWYMTTAPATGRPSASRTDTVRSAALAAAALRARQAAARARRMLAA